MAEATVPDGRKTQRAPAVKEVHVLWITAGLGCDGDSVSITAATQPSIEDVIMGAIPGLLHLLPRVLGRAYPTVRPRTVLPCLWRADAGDQDWAGARTRRRRD